MPLSDWALWSGAWSWGVKGCVKVHHSFRTPPHGLAAGFPYLTWLLGLSLLASPALTWVGKSAFGALDRTFLLQPVLMSGDCWVTST